MRDPQVRRASKKAYYERNKARLREQALARYHAAREIDVPPPSGDQKKSTVSQVTRKRPSNSRDPEKRKASKAAYYERNKLRLREKAKERMRQNRALQDEETRLAHRRLAWSYRNTYAELLHIRRANLYRKRWVLKRGVDEFVTKFRGRLEAPQGFLMEHWDRGTILSVFQ